MRIGMVGLGRMGGNMSVRLLRHEHSPVGYARGVASREAVAQQGVEVVETLDALVAALEPPRAIWLMVPSGAPTESVLGSLRESLADGDLVVDGGNSYFRDSVRHARALGERGIRFVDAGVSGGVWGLENGYCMMVGGEGRDVDTLRPVLDALAPPRGWSHVGPHGAGHFVKMVHNGIEYGLMQAYAEGFEIMRASEFGIDLRDVAGIWRYGSVVRSWLRDLLYAAFEQEGNELERIAGYVQDSG
ncbi:MAG TPA: NADP-dependent phosphogluconate dehydrogenase, partial [Actinomycetota bacterium]|nr:NADP-dependent phosphogluconate dehydrogenase [Actinomycetota bacterium]